MDKYKFVCVSKNDFFKHQRKIDIGEVYLGYYVRKSLAIYTKSNEFIGFYDISNFKELDELRNIKINEILNP
jgi:hypothetical protein